MKASFVGQILNVDSLQGTGETSKTSYCGCSQRANSLVGQLLNFKAKYESTEDFVKTQILLQYVWGGPQILQY